MKEAVLGRGVRAPRGITVRFHMIPVVGSLLPDTQPRTFTATGGSVWGYQIDGAGPWAGGGAREQRALFPN